MNDRRIESLRSAEAGFGLMEVLVAMVFAGVVSLAIASSLIVSMRTEKITEVHFAAATVASSRVEELAARDALEIDSSFDESDTPVSWGDLNLTFLRSTNITVNPDDSRTIAVTVRTNHPNLPTRVTFRTTLALWE